MQVSRNKSITPDRARASKGLTAAEETCQRRGARLTPLRRRVLELVLASGKPIGAYGLLDQLRAEGAGGAPPTVYRALEFLQTHGLVHRIAKSNTFVACRFPRDHHFGLIFVCRHCGISVEMEEQRVIDDISHCAGQLGFRMPSQAFEVEGTCRDCRDGA